MQGLAIKSNEKKLENPCGSYEYYKRWNDDIYIPGPRKPAKWFCPPSQGSAEALIVGRKVIYYKSDSEDSDSEGIEETEWRAWDPTSPTQTPFCLMDYPLRMKWAGQEQDLGPMSFPKVGFPLRSELGTRILRMMGWEPGQGLNYYSVVKDNATGLAREIQAIRLSRIEERLSRIQRHFEHPARNR